MEQTGVDNSAGTSNKHVGVRKVGNAAKPLNYPVHIDTLTKQKKSKRKSIWTAFSDYCGHTSIHGVQFLGEEERHWSERIVWVICILSSSLICSHFIHNMWKKWEETPVIVSFSETSTPIWNIPFPAITICPQTKTRRKIFNFTAFYEFDNVSFDDKDYNEKEKRFAALALVCDPETTDWWDFSDVQSFNIVRTLTELAPKAEDILTICKFNNFDITEDCNDHFEKIITDIGVCFSFNALPSNELFVYSNNSNSENDTIEVTWTLEDGYDRNVGIDNEYPWHIHTSGINRGLDIFLETVESDVDILCRGLIQGYNVLIHSPDEMPHLTKQNFKLPLGKEVVVNVKPEMTRTSESLKNSKPEHRHCFFNSERRLKYFKIYNQQNCEIECLVDYTHAECKCVPYWIPVPSGMAVCNATMIECMANAESDMNSSEFAHGLAKSSKNANLDEATEVENLDCNCLPACTSIIYSSDTSQADFYVKRSKKVKYAEATEGTIRSRLKVGFAVNQFITSKRSELYGLNDFIANCGGLMGLFLGISALSFVEIFYFCSCRRLKAKKKSIIKVQ